MLLVRLNLDDRRVGSVSCRPFSCFRLLHWVMAELLSFVRVCNINEVILEPLFLFQFAACFSPRLRFLNPQFALVLLFFALLAALERQLFFLLEFLLDV